MSLGRLRIFLGMCPGVGKTYAMLLAAQQRQEEGVDVAIGWVETHGRIETTALTAGLRRIAPRRSERRGVELLEMDLDALLERRPGLALVDELAHTNAPGSRHPKRYQDVLELLAAGIDVFTTVNVQHVESLRDAVAGITGVRVRETVPDSVIDRADEIEVIDVTPEQLRARLAEGKVYLGERAASAADAFFREGNLKALREMALRLAAERADREVRTFLKGCAIAGPWRARERLMVAVGGSPHAERLVRITRRMAGALDGTWLAVHVESGDRVDEVARAGIARNLALARSLGAELVPANGVDPAEALLQVARRENVTQIVLGKTLDESWWNRVCGGGLAERLVRHSGEIDVMLVHPGGADGEVAERRTVRNVAPGRWRDWALSAGVLVLVSLVGLLAEPVVGYRSVTMLYMLAVAGAGLFLRRWPVMGLAIGSGVAWNFLFTDPRMTFVMWHDEDLVLLLTFVAVAAVVGHQTARLLRRERASAEAEMRARTLYELMRAVGAASELEPALERALRQVEAAFDVEAAVVVSAEGGGETTVLGCALTEKELAVCRWTVERREAAGRFTGTLPESPVLALPLATEDRRFGALVVRPTGDSLASPMRRDLLEAFASHVVVLLERDAAVRAGRDARVQAASAQLQRALLDDVAHELKTPAAVIRTAVEQLQVGEDGEREDLLREVERAASRLDRVTSQLVTLSRLEAGLIVPQVEVGDAEDLLQEVAEDFSAEAGRLRVTAEAGVIFRADGGLLHSALANLVANALRHGPTGTVVELRAASRAGGGVEFVVDDCGPGVPEEGRERVFERFARGDGGGLGLGLSIARQFVEAMGGMVGCGERPGGGARFWIRLPGGVGTSLEG